MARKDKSEKISNPKQRIYYAITKNRVPVAIKKL